MQDPKETQLKLYAATEIGDRLCGNGYVNRHTGEVRLWGDRQANYELGGEDLIVDVLDDQSAIKSDPEAWVQVPKFDAKAQADFKDVTAMLRAFLEENELPIRID